MKTPGGMDNMTAEDLFGPSPTSSSSRTPSTPVGGVGKGKKNDNNINNLRMIRVDSSMCCGKLRGNDVICIKKKCIAVHQGEGNFELSAGETVLMVQRNTTSAHSTLALRPEQFDEGCINYILSL